MSRRGDELWEERYDRFSEAPVRSTAKVVGLIVAGVVTLALVFGVIGWIGGWFNKAAEVTGAENTDAQFTALYDDIESMRATAGNVCAATQAPESANSPTFLEGPEFAYAAKYRQIEADYNRRFENLFEAKGLLVKPPDLPRRAPTLQQTTTEVCP